MDKKEFVEELRNLTYSAWVAGEPWNQFGFSCDEDELHFLVGDKVFVVKVEEYAYEDLLKAYGSNVGDAVHADVHVADDVHADAVHVGDGKTRV